MYLHFNSYHPQNQKSSIPYSQAICLRQICSTPELFREATRQLSENLYLRGYPKHMIKTAMQTTSQKERTTLLQPRSVPMDRKQRIIPFTIVYNQCNLPVGKIIKRNKHILSSSPEQNDLLTSILYISI